MSKDDAMEFFKQEKGFHRLLIDMSIAYHRHGRTYGAVRLLNPSLEEERAISAFFERDYFDQALIRISLGDFKRQLEKTFPPLEFSQLLAPYLHMAGTLAIKPAAPSASQASKSALTAAIDKHLLKKYQGSPAFSWLSDMATHTRRTYKPWVNAYNQTPEKIVQMIDQVAHLINQLPLIAGPIPLLDFAKAHQLPLGDLTLGSLAGELFVRALAHYLNQPTPYSMAMATALYIKAGLLYGGTLCQVLVKNLQGQPGHILDAYNKLNQAHVLTLENMVALKDLRAINNAVFIVEDPQVFVAIQDQLYSINPQARATCLCPGSLSCPGFGHLVDALFAGGADFYYAGNIDYKGLLAADGLYLKLGKQFIPWRYGKKDYQAMLDAGSRLLQGEKKDLAMHNDDLALILSRMRKTGKTGHRHVLIPQMAQDILAVLKT